MQTVDAPVALLTTVRTVPNGKVGLAQYPAGAAAYHVAWPTSLFDRAGGAVVVVVVEGGGGGDVVVVTCAVEVVTAAAVVDVTGGAVVVVVDPDARYATRCEGKSTVSRCDEGYTTDR